MDVVVGMILYCDWLKSAMKCEAVIDIHNSHFDAQINILKNNKSIIDDSKF